MMQRSVYMQRRRTQHGQDQAGIVRKQEGEENKQDDLKPLFTREFPPGQAEEKNKGICPVCGIEEDVLAVAQMKRKVEKQNQDEGKCETIILLLQALYEKKSARE